MEFYTVVNAEGKFVVPAFILSHKEGKEPKWMVTERPCLFELFYDTVEKVREYYWSSFTSLDWSEIRMQKLKIELIN